MSTSTVLQPVFEARFYQSDLEVEVHDAHTILSTLVSSKLVQESVKIESVVGTDGVPPILRLFTTYSLSVSSSPTIN